MIDYSNKRYEFIRQRDSREIEKDIKTTIHPWCDDHFLYKYLWGVGGKGRGSSLQERASHTYTLRLGQSIILSCKKKKKKDINDDIKETVKEDTE